MWCQTLWHVPIIPPTWEVEVEGSQSEATPDEISRPYLKNILKAKGLGVCLAQVV